MKTTTWAILWSEATVNFDYEIEEESVYLDSNEADSDVARNAALRAARNVAERAARHGNWQKAREDIANAILYNQLPSEVDHPQMGLCEDGTCQSKCDVLVVGLTGNCPRDQARAIALTAYNRDEKINGFLQMLVVVCGSSTWGVLSIQYDTHSILYTGINSVKHHLERQSFSPLTLWCFFIGKVLTIYRRKLLQWVKELVESSFVCRKRWRSSSDSSSLLTGKSRSLFWSSSSEKAIKSINGNGQNVG